MGHSDGGASTSLLAGLAVTFAVLACLGWAYGWRESRRRRLSQAGLAVQPPSCPSGRVRVSDAAAASSKGVPTLPAASSTTGVEARRSNPLVDLAARASGSKTQYANLGKTEIVDEEGAPPVQNMLKSAKCSQGPLASSDLLKSAKSEGRQMSSDL